MASYLDYYKNILTKVSFDPQLFYKEYRKATRYLHSGELSELNNWLVLTGFHNMLPERLDSDPIRYDSMEPHRHREPAWLPVS